MPNKYHIGLLVLGIVLMAALCVTEILTGVLGTVAYVAITGFILWFVYANKRAIIVMGVMATLFLYCGYQFTIGDTSDRITFIINRVMAVGVVWLAVYFIERYRNTEVKVSRNREQLQALFNAATEGIIIINTHGRIVMINPFALVMFGYAKAEILNQRIELLIPDRTSNDPGARKAEVLSRSEGNQADTSADLLGFKKDGSSFPVSVNLAQFVTDEGVFFVAFVLDITEQKNWEKEIHQLNETLEGNVARRTAELTEAIEQVEEINLNLQSEIHERALIERKLKETLVKEKELGELKSRFVALASHEFRSPLTTILSSTFLLENYTGQQYEKEKLLHLGRIKRSVKLLTEILNDFLSVGKLDEGKIEPKSELIAWPDFMHELYKDVESLKRDGQSICISHTGSQAITSDKQLLRNISINLISNAFKYSNAHGQVVLETTVDNNTLTMRVIDNGMGIPEEEQKYIFKRFYRANNVANIQGTGLGLNIVKKYVELLGGTISFMSALQTGTTFMVTIPVQHSEEKTTIRYEPDYTTH